MASEDTVYVQSVMHGSMNGIMFAIMDVVMNGIVVMELMVLQLRCGIVSSLLRRVIQELPDI